MTAARVGWDARRLTLTRLVLGAAFVAGLLVTPTLFLSARRYPLTPVIDGLPAIPPPLDLGVLVALVVLVALASVVPRPRVPIAAAVVVALALAVTDQSRWQPWFYQYVVMLAALALPPGRDEGATAVLDVCRLVVSGIYVWSGLQKLNPAFAADVFPWFVGPLLHVLPPGLRGIVTSAWWVVPLVEVGVGLALPTRRLRTVAVVLAVTTHGAILALLGPLGHGANAVVWPWNVAMALFVVLLFWRDDGSLRPGGDARVRGAWTIAVLLFWVMPAFSFVGRWDAYLSGALYSGNIAQAVIAITPRLRARLPADIDRHVIVNRVGTHVLTPWDWSMAELGAPPYPERRVYVNVGRTLCRYGDAPDDLKLVIVERRTLFRAPASRTYDCAGERRRSVSDPRSSADVAPPTPSRLP